MTQKTPMVDLWCSLKFKKDYGKGSAGTSLWVLWLTAGWGKDVLTVLKTVGGSDLRFFLYVPLESPCSPMIQPCTLFGGMFSFSPIKKWNRAVSRLVPLPITRSAGRPLIFHATYVKTSTETWRKNRYCYTSECGSGSSRGCLIERFHSASMQIYWNKRKRLHEKSVKFPTWPPWCHVKTLYTFSVDCEQSLFFFRFSESNARARERRSHPSRAWPFACLAFCSMDYRKKRDCS